MTLTIHEACETPLGSGTIVYWRFAPPDYSDVASNSVRLESAPQRFIPYQGTIFNAADVRVLRNGEWISVRSNGEQS